MFIILEASYTEYCLETWGHIVRAGLRPLCRLLMADAEVGQGAVTSLETGSAWKPMGHTDTGLGTRAMAGPEALAGAITRPAGQVPHDLWEKRHFQCFTLTQDRASRGDWWSLRWVQQSLPDMLSKHSTQCLLKKFREACTWESSSYVSLTPEREPSVCLYLVNESCLK